MAKNSLYRDRNLQIIFVVTLMAVLGVSSITSAFPGVTGELGITGDRIELFITFFTLPGVIMATIPGPIYISEGLNSTLFATATWG